MAQTKQGAIKVAASRLGISREEYILNIKNGLKWCTGCKKWHHYTAFGLNKLKTDGLAQSCLAFNREYHKKRYAKKEKVSRRGCRYVKARDGDKKQARRRVNHMVDVGLLPNPNDLPCSNCNNKNESKRNEYHHHNGYSPEHHEDVVVLCTYCHSREEPHESD